MMNPEQCAEQQRLARSLAMAIQQTFIARHELRAAKNERIPDTARFNIALERAMLKQREAEKAHQKHVEEHRCVLDWRQKMRA